MVGDHASPTSWCLWLRAGGLHWILSSMRFYLLGIRFLSVGLPCCMVPSCWNKPLHSMASEELGLCLTGRGTKSKQTHVIGKTMGY